MIYLLSGLEPKGREVLDPHGGYPYEAIHRHGGWVLSNGRHGVRKVAGHSGYTDRIFTDSDNWVADWLPTMDRSVTHFIPGILSPHVISRYPAIVSSWSTPDGSPAILTVLQPAQRRNMLAGQIGMKIALLPNARTQARRARITALPASTCNHQRQVWGLCDRACCYLRRAESAPCP